MSQACPMPPARSVLASCEFHARPHGRHIAGRGGAGAHPSIITRLHVAVVTGAGPNRLAQETFTEHDVRSPGL